MFLARDTKLAGKNVQCHIFNLGNVSSPPLCDM